ncbi:3-ketoacyl-CoA synthase 11 [Turnera subulata]|uniref:3-ketoacyl-CoA synthase n=1 Tax=Turnera subulata TaxID=218843 RepID=A0A9Q0GGJ5_9ROSI|nr:3-ketoacyl-CoA synthase 11 [Turnera subulata]
MVFLKFCECKVLLLCSNMGNEKRVENPENGHGPAAVHVLPEKKRNLPNFFLSVKLKYVKLGYHYLVSNAMYLFLVPVICTLLAHLSNVSVENFTELWNHLRLNHFLTVILCSVSLAFAATLYFMSRPRKVYLVDFACYKPQPSQKCTKERFMQVAKGLEGKLVIYAQDIGEIGVWPSDIRTQGLDAVAGEYSMAAAMDETDVVIFGAIDDLLAKTGVRPRDIGILVVNSSLFNPTPSLSARIVNRYKLRGNILSYNLGGMGCSAGLISIDLAKSLLQVQPNSYALVVSTENLTRSWYRGNERSMLVTNCLFRVGAAAVLLSNKFSDRRGSKYRLVHTARTHKGADDKCFNCVLQQEDDKQNVGLSLSKDLMAVAGEALKINITTLGPLVLPVSEQLLFFVSLNAKKVFKMKIKPYIPDFKLAFEHFCIHAGGRGVLDELEKNLKLTPWHMEPSRMTLYRFGNTSGSSLWYELAYSEAKGRIRKGDRIWQIGFGSGFKCNSAVWDAIKTINPAKDKNPWMDEIDEFPVQVPGTYSLFKSQYCLSCQHL